MRLGIDFGTTHTVVAYCDRGNYPIVSFTDGGESHEWFPSLLAEHEASGEWLAGFEAARAAAPGPESGWTLYRSFKRLLSTTDRERGLELATRFLTALYEAIRQRSTLPAGPDEPLEVVIAAPANAPGAQRFLTMEAFRRAGFSVLALLNEPSAAGFEYTHRWRTTLTSKRDAIVVYDLGGGTFDVSLIRAAGRHHEVTATAGLPRLGGDDFDEALAELVLAAAGRKREDVRPAAYTHLLDRCREAKEALSPNTRRILVDLDPVLGAGSGEVSVPVVDFYTACAPLVEETLLGMAPIVRSLDQEESDGPAAAELTEVAGIYVVGGASALPLVQRALKERFGGRRVHRSPYPFAATAIGLAIAADSDAGFTLRDQLSRHFGVFREAQNGRAVAFDSIFSRDLPLPPPGGAPVCRERIYRAVHNLGWYRFAECSSVEEGVPSGDLTPVGEIRFAFDPGLRSRPDAELASVPVERRLDGPLVKEEYQVDPSGIVSVTISDLETGYEKQFRLGG